MNDESVAHVAITADHYHNGHHKDRDRACGAPMARLGLPFARERHTCLRNSLQDMCSFVLVAKSLVLPRGNCWDVDIPTTS